MKTAEASFKFPVLGFTPDRDIWGFPDLDALTSCGSWTLRDDLQRGLELIDTDGRRWVVRSIRKVGRARPLLKWLLLCGLGGPLWRIEQELDECEPVSLQQVKNRVCAAIEAFPDVYQDDCCDNPEHEHEGRVETLLAQVNSAKSIAAVHDLMGLDSFMAY